MTATVAGILLSGDHASRPAATVPPVGSLYSCSDHALVYVTDGATWSTWATLGGTVPSFDTPTIALGTAAAAGAAGTVIRSDATIAAFDATVPVTQNYGDAAATGAAAVAARRDHVHGMPASAGVTYGTPALVLGTSNAAGATAEAIRRDATILVFDTTDPAATTPGQAADDGVATTAARRDHVHPRLGDTFTLQYVIDGGGSAITTGVKGDVYCPFAFTITGVVVLADQSGSIVVDIWKDSYANYPPTDADSITASAPPTLSTATKSKDTTLTGWTTTVAADSTLRYNVDSITTCTRVVVALQCTRT